jgi:hypothetical protein
MFNKLVIANLLGMKRIRNSNNKLLDPGTASPEIMCMHVDGELYQQQRETETRRCLFLMLTWWMTKRGVMMVVMILYMKQLLSSRSFRGGKNGESNC